MDFSSNLNSHCCHVIYDLYYGLIKILDELIILFLDRTQYLLSRQQWFRLGNPESLIIK